MRGCALRKVVRNLAHKNWKTGESNPSTSLHRSRDQRRPVGHHHHQLVATAIQPNGLLQNDKPHAIQTHVLSLMKMRFRV